MTSAEFGIFFRQSLDRRWRQAGAVLRYAIAKVEFRAVRRKGAVLDEYVTGMPSAQNAVDALPGWNHSLPEHVGAIAGKGAFFCDNRILWALQQYGSIDGKHILELGPLEAGHTYLLENQGAKLIHAIEANKLSFLRCLVVKELLDLKNAKFFLGNFVEWLKNRPQRYDLVIACGVLYHMEDPIELLQLISQAADSFYLWTHYASDEAMPAGDPRRSVFLGTRETREYCGIPMRLYTRSYHGAWKDKAFCGGIHDVHRWVEKEDILKLIHALGFTDIRVAHDEPDHQHGPSFSIFARRMSPQENSQIDHAPS